MHSLNDGVLYCILKKLGRIFWLNYSEVGQENFAFNSMDKPKRILDKDICTTEDSES